MDFYSITLGLALTASIGSFGLALVHGLASWGVETSERRTPGVRSVAWALGFIALLLVTVSASLHLFTGHAPGSSSALGPIAFLREHPAFLVSVAMAVAALILLRITKAMSRKPEGA